MRYLFTIALCLLLISCCDYDNCLDVVLEAAKKGAKKPIGASKPLIAQALGHGRITVTDTYFDFDNELVDDLNRKILDLLNS